MSAWPLSWAPIASMLTSQLMLILVSGRALSCQLEDFGSDVLHRQSSSSQHQVGFCFQTTGLHELNTLRLGAARILLFAFERIQAQIITCISHWSHSRREHKLLINKQTTWKCCFKVHWTCIQERTRGDLWPADHLTTSPSFPAYNVIIKPSQDLTPGGFWKGWRGSAFWPSHLNGERLWPEAKARGTGQGKNINKYKCN